MSNMMDFNMKPVTLKDCKIPAQTLDAKTIYKLTVSFKENGVQLAETQDINLITLEDDFPKPSCALEGFNDTIMLEEGMEHRINLKVFDAMDGQQYRWTCAPSADAMFSEEAKCPFEIRPLTLNPQLVIADAEFSPAGSKFELNLNLVRQNTNIIE